MTVTGGLKVPLSIGRLLLLVEIPPAPITPPEPGTPFPVLTGRVLGGLPAGGRPEDCSQKRSSGYAPGTRGGDEA